MKDNIRPHFNFNDWCHVCGHRSYHTVDIWLPRNAEHAKPREFRAREEDVVRYVRICLDCAQEAVRCALGMNND